MAMNARVDMMATDARVDAAAATLGDWDDDERDMMQFLLFGGSPNGVDDADPLAPPAQPAAQTAPAKKKKAPAAPKGSKAKLTAVERRAKHREVVRRSYHRNKAVLADLKDTVKRLEEQMHTLQVARASEAIGNNNNDNESHQQHAAPSQDAPALQRTIDELSAQATQLEREAAQLQQSLRTHKQFVATVCTASTSSSDDSSDDDVSMGTQQQQLPVSPWREPSVPETSDEDYSPDKRRAKSKFYHTPRPAHVLGPTVRAPLATALWRELAYKPLSLAQAREFVGETYQGILTFALSGRAVSTGARVMGWEDKRLVDGTAIKFSLRKQFMGENAQALMTSTWLCFSDPECADEKFRGLLTLRILQHVNEDTIVALRDTVSPDSATVYRCVYLLFRVRTRSGFIICSRSIDHVVVGPKDALAPRTKDGRAIQWAHVFGWFVFDQLGYADPTSSLFHETGAQVEYGGSMNYGDASHVPMLALDTLSIVSRWEGFMVHPVFKLPPSSAPPAGAL